MTNDAMRDATAPIQHLEGQRTRIRTRVQDCDTDHLGRMRKIPIGTVGAAHDWNGETYEIHWMNGAVTMWTPDEIMADADILDGRN